MILVAFRGILREPSTVVHPLHEQPCAAARSPPPPPSPPPCGVVHRAGIETRRNARRPDRTDSRESIGPASSSTSLSSLKPAAAILAACPRDEEACTASHATARVARTSGIPSSHGVESREEARGSGRRRGFRLVEETRFCPGDSALDLPAARFSSCGKKCEVSPENDCERR